MSRSDHRDRRQRPASVRLVRAWLIPAIVASLSASRPEAADETNEQRFIVSVERIWDRAGHSAFTDLIRFQDALYCTFREGSGRIPGLNGTIRVIRSRDGMNWESVALLGEPHVDLRNPKLSVTPDGRLMISMGASYYHGMERQRIESRVAFSSGFRPLQKIVLPESLLTGFDWLWRVTWHDGWAWGCVQQVPPGADRKLQLVRSRDGIRYQHVATLDVDHPTETTLRFWEDGTMLAVIHHTAAHRKPGSERPSRRIPTGASPCRTSASADRI